MDTFMTSRTKQELTTMPEILLLVLERNNIFLHGYMY